MLCKSTELVSERFAGIQANASALNPEELNNCFELKSDKPEQWVDEMLCLRKYKQIKIFGGCCGTDNSHIDELAKKLLIARVEEGK